MSNPSGHHGHPLPLSPQNKVRSAPNLGVDFVGDDDAGAAGRKRTVCQIGDGGGLSHAHGGSMIESMYGLERRHNSQPYKRVKSAETLARDQGQKVNAPFATGGSDGLGKWMKDSATATLPPSSKIVDLTSGKGVCLCF